MTSYVYDPKSDIEKERLLERDKRTSQRRSFALEGIEIPRGSTILDVGCGTGV
jgi:ubiquinone/menaquinone biosynthesis C-methylase UbiE